MVRTILLHNAHIVRQSSGLVLPEVLTFRYKVCESLPLVGREYTQLLAFLGKKTAIVKVQNTENTCFRVALSSERANIVENHPERFITTTSSRTSPLTKSNTPPKRPISPPLKTR